MRLTISPLNMALAKAAANEHQARERHYPALIKAGKISAEDAKADMDAWRVVAELFATGTAATDTTFSALHLFTSRCLRELDKKVEAATAGNDDRLPRLIERRDMVWAIHHRIELQRYLIDDVTADLRARTEASRKVA